MFQVYDIFNIPFLSISKFLHKKTPATFTSRVFFYALKIPILLKMNRHVNEYFAAYVIIAAVQR